jgi:uncharacterized protein YkwD
LKSALCAAKLLGLPSRRHIAEVFATFFAVFAVVSPAPAATLTVPERSVLAEMNRVRAGHGLQRLQVDYRLQLAARAHARDMLQRDYFAHGPFLSRLLGYGASGPIFGENLAWGTGIRAQARTIVSDWLASPSHRRTLLRAGFERVGVGAPSGTFRGIAGVRMVAADFAGS